MSIIVSTTCRSSSICSAQCVTQNVNFRAERMFSPKVLAFPFKVVSVLVGQCLVTLYLAKCTAVVIAYCTFFMIYSPGQNS